jgi:hypothetical protein
MRRNTGIALGVILLVLAALAAKSLLLTTPHLRDRAAPGQFDAVAAKSRLARVLGDERPHPADSAADDAVRARLIAELQSMGLNPVVRDQFACNDFAKARLIACARVRNVITEMGPASGKALLVSAHYDSVPVGPGASDDGIGMATLLEVASILKDRPLRRPVILLFNEGEELGLVGARAFLGDPLSRQVDSVLNFDARGVTGRATMFETSGPQGSAIAAFSRAVPRPFASSLSTDVARLIPNDTDMTVYKERGWLGLNFGVIGNETRYHSPGDDLAGLDPRSLQDMGDQALALASELSAGTPAVAGQRIFFDLFGRLFIQMPMSAGIIGLVCLILLFGAVAWKRNALIRATAVSLGAIVAGGLLAFLAIMLMGMLRSGNYWRAQPEISYLAIYATAIVGPLTVLVAVRAKLSTRELRAGYWLLFLLIGGALALLAPGAIIYFLFPPLAVLIGILLGRRFAHAETASALIGLLLLYLTWGEMLSAFEELFTPGPLWMVVPIVAIMIVPALVEAQALIRGAGPRPLLLGSALIALAGWTAAAASPAYSPDHQQRFTIEHVTDFASDKSFWSVLNDGAALPPVYPSAGKWRRTRLSFSERLRWIAPAPALAGAIPPKMQVVEATRDGDQRSLRLRIQANGAQRLMLILPEQSELRSAGIDPFVRSLAGASGGKFIIACFGRSCDGAELKVELGGNPQPVTIVGARDGLPAYAGPLVRARPANARPQYTPDESLTLSRVSL